MQNNNLTEQLNQFIENWKNATINWYYNMHKAYKAEKARLDEIMPIPKTIDSAKEQMAQYKELEKWWRKHKVNYNDKHLIISIHNEYQKNKVLENTEKEAKKRIKLFLKNIEEKAGTIQEAYLQIMNGEINGTIKGTIATVTINTITAGGYNIQRLHYRTLIKVYENKTTN